MISQLYIKNIAVIKEIAIEFFTGLHVFTGETGAGKSIVIDSIHGILGGRTSKNIIRFGEEKGEISAIFCHLSQDIKRKIEALGFVYEGELHLERLIFIDGKNQCKINGKPCTVSMLKEVGELLMDIHGQQDTGSLLREGNHLNIIDSYGGLQEEKEKYYRLFKELAKMKKELDQLLEKGDKRESRIEKLNDLIEDVGKINPTECEYTELLKKKERYTHEKKQIEHVMVIEELFLGEGENHILSLLYQSQQEMEELSKDDKEMEPLLGKISSLYEESSKFLEELKSKFHSIELDYDMEEILHRLEKMEELKRTYNISLDEILEEKKGAEKELEVLLKEEEKIDILETQAEDYLEKTIKLGKKLQKKRLSAANSFVKRVLEDLKFLNMPHAKLSYEHRDKKLTSLGMDEFTFQLSTNQGEPAKNMSKIASGGELSRIMLSMKGALSKKGEIPTLIFDEIDTGVSGLGAEKIGIKLKELSQYHQIICITHSPQIAAFAQEHYYVEKTDEKNRTYTKVLKLKPEEKRLALARMISGENVTSIALENADEMILNGENKLTK